MPRQDRYSSLKVNLRIRALWSWSRSWCRRTVAPQTPSCKSALRSLSATCRMIHRRNAPRYTLGCRGETPGSKTPPMCSVHGRRVHHILSPTAQFFAHQHRTREGTLPDCFSEGPSESSRTLLEEPQSSCFGIRRLPPFFRERFELLAGTQNRPRNRPPRRSFLAPNPLKLGVRGPLCEKRRGRQSVHSFISIINDRRKSDRCQEGKICFHPGGFFVDPARSRWSS